MADHKEQRVCVKFCFLLGKTAAETVGMLRQAFNDDALWRMPFTSKNKSTLFSHLIALDVLSSVVVKLESRLQLSVTFLFLLSFFVRFLLYPFKLSVFSSYFPCFPPSPSRYSSSSSRGKAFRVYPV
jgi:hypothetical protein